MTALRARVLFGLAILTLGAACAPRLSVAPSVPSIPVRVVAAPRSATTVVSAALRRVLENAHKQTHTTRIYDPAYVVLPYPNGDVPQGRGVCADVIVRAFRAGGVDLQKNVHEDMTAHFSAYPRLWGLRRADPNIDHRRVANLRTYFTRKGQSRPVTQNPSDYRPGDVVAWELPGGRLHIGLVSDRSVPDASRRQVIHNIGAGTREEDVLFAWKIIGHYRGFR